MPFIERFPKIKIGPIEIGDKFGDPIKEGEIRWYETGGDLYTDWGFGVKVISPEESQIELHADPDKQVLNRYFGEAINRSPARGVIRFVKE